MPLPAPLLACCKHHLASLCCLAVRPRVPGCLARGLLQCRALPGRHNLVRACLAARAHSCASARVRARWPCGRNESSSPGRWWGQEMAAAEGAGRRGAQAWWRAAPG